MSDTSWDWWFGDGPDRGASRRKPNHVSNESRRRRVRRRMIAFFVAVSASTVASSLWADEAGRELSFAAFLNAPLSTFGMLDSDEESAVSDKAAESKSESKQDADDKEVDEDERRRQRLRELLREDDGPADRKEDGEKEDKGKTDDDESDDNGLSKRFLQERLPEIESGRLMLPPLQAVSTQVSSIGNGRLPEDFDADLELPHVALPEDAYARGMVSPGVVYPWAAPNTFSHPLYFEDRMLERHGHERWGCLQPIAAGARFFATVPMLPYLATIQEPCDTVYSKGYYRAGSAAPCLYQRPPLEKRAVTVEAAAIATSFIALP